jgi:hypothetical protein
MPRIAGCAVATPMGDLDATVGALLAASGGPGTLAGSLCERLLALSATALAGRRPDLVLLATTKGEVGLWCDALLAADGGYHGGPAWLARILGERLGAPAFAVNAACASGPLAAGVAARWLGAGRAQLVLLLGADRCGPFVVDGFTALKALDPIACRPFDAERVGLRLGEAAAAVVLEADAREQAGAPGLHLQGWGASMDANHLTGPSRDGSGLASACRRALARAGGPVPALVIAHGTGTRYNDDSESLAYAAACPGTPITALKGVIGHSLGACGVVELACAQEFRRAGRCSGTVNLRRQGCAGKVRVLPPGTHPLPPGALLAANAGFGGLNGALVIAAQPAPPAAPRSATCVLTAELGPHCWTRQRPGQPPEEQAWSEPGSAGALPRLSAREVHGAVDASWGRMDLACRALVALGQVLAPLPGDCAVVLCSASGCAATDRLYEGERRGGSADPQRFAYTLPSTPIGELSIRLKLRGPGLVLQGASAEQARQVAADLLAECPAVLLAWIEADRPPHLARAELWQAG